MPRSLANVSIHIVPPAATKRKMVNCGQREQREQREGGSSLALSLTCSMPIREVSFSLPLVFMKYSTILSSEVTAREVLSRTRRDVSMSSMTAV